MSRNSLPDCCACDLHGGRDDEARDGLADLQRRPVGFRFQSYQQNNSASPIALQKINVLRNYDEHMPQSYSGISTSRLKKA
jgi:hypothetical protein